MKRRIIQWLLVCGTCIGAISASAANQPKPECISFPRQERLGNIFEAGEKVTILADVSRGEKVEWRVMDYHGAKLAEGTENVRNGRIALHPAVAKRGFYAVRLTAETGDKAEGEAATYFAVMEALPPGTPRPADPRFGAMTHFSQGMPTEVLPLLAKAGISTVRDDIPWKQVEQSAGKFDFSAGDGRVANYMAKLAEEHVSPLPVLAFANPLYDDGNTPYTAKGDAAYAHYCREVVEHFGKQLPAIEIWNEYNGSFCTGPATADRPASYTAMLKAAYSEVKQTRPDVTVVGGAVVKVPLPYFEKLFKLGALDSMDAVAVHPYQSVPEGVEREIGALAELMKTYNHGQAKPIWVTETSNYLDATAERVGSASYLVRMDTLLLTQPAVQRIYWYLAHDYREFKNLGLLHGREDRSGSYTPTAAYVAYANLIDLMRGKSFTRREATDQRTRVYRFDGPGGAVWVCWSTQGESALAFSRQSELRVVDSAGAEDTLPPKDGPAVVKIGAEPLFVTAQAGTPVTVREIPRPDRVIADSVEQFSGKQERDGWSYGYYTSNRDGPAPYITADFKPMTWRASRGDWVDQWQGPLEYLVINEGDSSPQASNGKQIWAIRRWKSDVDGAVRMVGSVNRGPKGDGVECRIFVDGKEIYGKSLAPESSETFDLPATLKKGSLVDFAVTPGRGLDANFDATGFRISILTANANPR